MANMIFENFCKLNSFIDVIVEIVSRNIEGVNRYSVLIRKYEDEDFVFGEFPVKKGLINGFNTLNGIIWQVNLNMNLLEKTSMQKNYSGRYFFSGAGVNSFTIQFFSDSSQQKFLSKIRRIQKM